MTETSPLMHIKKAWRAYKPNWKFIVPAAIVSLIIYIVFQVLSRATQGHPGASFIIAIISIIVSLAVSLGWSQIALRLMRSGSAKWPDFKTSPKTWVHYFLARIILGIFSLIPAVIVAFVVIPTILKGGAGLITVSVLVGLIGLILIIWLQLRFMFISFVAVDQPTMRGWGLMKASWRLTKRHGWKIFVFALALILLNIVGVIAIVIGLFVTVPMSAMATASLYDYFKNSSSVVAPEHSETEPQVTM